MALWDSESFVLKTKISFTQKEMHLLFGFQEKERGFFLCVAWAALETMDELNKNSDLVKKKIPPKKQKTHCNNEIFIYALLGRGQKQHRQLHPGTNYRC